MLGAGPNFFAYCAGSKFLRRFCASRNIFEAALNAIQFSVGPKKIGPAQNILGPVEGQGNRKEGNN